MLMVFTTIRNIEGCILGSGGAGGMILVFVVGEFSDIIKNLSTPHDRSFILNNFHRCTYTKSLVIKKGYLCSISRKMLENIIFYQM